MSLLPEIFKDLSVTIPLSLLVAIALTSALADFLPLRDPYEINLRERLLPPSAEHPMGTDQLGRDLLSRIVHGGKYTLLASTAAILLALLLGIALGLLSGYYGGNVDLALQRVVDILMAFPAIVLAIAIATFLGGGLESLVIAVGLAETPFMARVVRGAVISVRSMPFIESAQLLGYGDLYIMARHVLPNVFYAIVTQATLQMGSSVLIIAALGFLGIGVRPPTPEWGSMLNEARAYIMDHPHLLFFPGLMIFLTITCFNFLGESLKAHVDPRYRTLVKPRRLWALGLPPKH